MKQPYGELIAKRARYLKREFGDHALGAQAVEVSKQSLTDVLDEGVGGRPFVVSAGASLDTPATVATDESIVWAQRPVLLVQDDRVDPLKTALPYWQEQLAATGDDLPAVLRAVGRIEVANAPTLRAAGTGWLISDEVVVTNRHVADHFARSHRGRLVFRQGVGGRMAPRVDFVEEFERTAELEAPVVEVLWLADDPGPDVAFLRIDRSNASIDAAPLSLPSDGPRKGDMVAVVGYPVHAPKGMDPELVQQVFGTIWEKKRLAPGFVSGLRRGVVLHDCSTLHGNSGSPVIQLKTGAVVGLHYQGVFEVENRAVAADEVWDLLQKARRQRPPPQTPLRARDEARDAHLNGIPVSSGASSVNVTIPINVSIQFGAGSAPTVSVSAGAPASSREALDEADAVDQLSEAMGLNAAVLRVEAGWDARDGQLTDDRVLYVVVKESAERTAADPHEVFGVPREYGGFVVELFGAGPEDLDDELSNLFNEDAAGPARYRKPENLDLPEFDEQMFLCCHASPDAAWPSLEEFLDRTDDRLTIGMYELTAPHVVEKLVAVLGSSKKLDVAIHRGSSGLTGSKKDDLDEAREVVPRLRRELGNRLRYQWVPIGRRNGLVPSSYHIKVAVRDGEAVWISSGSWQSSNQPNISPAADGSTTFDALDGYNREWNVILQHRGIAQRLEEYIRWDMQQSRDLVGRRESAFAVESVVDEAPRTRRRGKARYFEPLTVSGRNVRIQPLLTPDRYWDEVEALLRSATRTLYFQNQSLNLSGGGQSPHFRRLLHALRGKQREGLDVRIIVRREYFDVLKRSRLRDYGFDLRDLRYQERCHNKGIIVDGEAVLVGSHNWTNSGTAWNRDASLIIRDKEVAQYFQKIFLYDWKNVAMRRPRGRRGRTIRLEAGAPLPSGFEPVEG